MTEVPKWLEWVGDVDMRQTNSIMRRVAASTMRPRAAAVLVLFGGARAADPRAVGGVPADADVLLTERSTTLRNHSGQVAFPGGGADPGDDGPIGTALREAREETGLDPAGVQPLATLPAIFVPPSRFNVVPVVAYWHTPSPVAVVDPAESQRVVRVPLADLLNPANRFQVRSPMGYSSPAFQVDGMLVWGFTAGVLAGLFTAAAWELPWDETDVRDLTAALAHTVDP